MSNVLPDHVRLVGDPTPHHDHNTWSPYDDAPSAQLALRFTDHITSYYEDRQRGRTTHHNAYQSEF